MLEELQHEITNLSCFQRRTFYASIKIFNILLHSLKILKHDKAKFKAALRKYLNTQHFYSVDDFDVSTSNISLV